LLPPLPSFFPLYAYTDDTDCLPSQTNKLAWERLPNHWNFMLFYTLWDLCELVFVWFMYPETKGPTLEEIARIFDGDGGVANIDMHSIHKDLYHHVARELDDDLPGKAL